MIRFPIVYVLFKMDASPLALSWASLIVYALAGCIIKPLLIVKYADYSWKEVLQTMYICLRVTLVAVPIPLVIYLLSDVEGSLLHSGIVLFVSLISVALSVWYVGLTKNMKQVLLVAVKLKLHKK